ESRRDYHHAQGHSATAHRRHHTATGSDQHQQECAPGLREHASPLKGGIEKIQCRFPSDRTLLLRRVRHALPSRFHVHLRCNATPAWFPRATVSTEKRANELTRSVGL